MWAPARSRVLLFPLLPFPIYKPAALLRTPSSRFRLPRVSSPFLWPLSSRSPSQSLAAPPGSWWPWWTALCCPRTARRTPCAFSPGVVSSPGPRRGRPTGPTQPRSRPAAQSCTSWRLRGRRVSVARFSSVFRCGWIEWLYLLNVLGVSVHLSRPDCVVTLTPARRWALPRNVLKAQQTATGLRNY